MQKATLHQSFDRGQQVEVAEDDSVRWYLMTAEFHFFYCVYGDHEHTKSFYRVPVPMRYEQLLVLTYQPALGQPV
jgi:hypothetical protein